MNRKLVLRTLTLVVLFQLTMAGALVAAPLFNEPITLQQPDGTVLKVLVSGDEYFNWIHDENGYTIIQDPATGYYTYAMLSEGRPVPTKNVVGRVDPKAAGLSKRALPSRDKIASLRSRFPGREGSGPENQGIEISNAPTAGAINNIVVFIRFSDESEFGVLSAPYDSLFNASDAGANSVYNYFMEASYGKLGVSTTFYPAAVNGYVVSYQDSQPRGYYQPYSATNTIGYSGGDDSTERRDREHTLLANAVNAIASSVPADLLIDADGDGSVDNICFIVKGQPTGWSSLLWPHKWSLYSRSVYLKGKRVYTYNLQLQTSMGTTNAGVLCHEMFHSLGAPDLYHYDSNGIAPVYAWDIMESNRNPPQHMSAYMKYKYGRWISDIPKITASGTYSLNPLTSSAGNIYQIDSPNSPDEFFVVEFRKWTGRFESSLPGEGMLVYRINPNYVGNAEGPPDEVYVFRPNGTPTANGSPAAAAFSSEATRTAINDSSNPYSFLTDGSLGGLDISAVGGVGSTISFAVRMPPLQLSRVSISPSTVFAGGRATGTVLLSVVAPSGGKTVTLSSNNAVVTVPTTVQIAAGSRTASFTANTSAVTSPTQVTITATLEGVSQTATLIAAVDTTAPSVAITTAGGLVSGTKTIAASAADNAGVAGVQFKLDGTNLGTEVTAAPYSLAWNTKTTNDGTHTVTAVARDKSGNSQTSAAVTFTVDNTAPTVTMSSSGGAFSGESAVLAATATDSVGIAGVQFKIDGTNFGAEVTTAPYSVAWDTTRFTNGAHSVTATARDLAGNVAVTAALTATVSNSTDFAITLPSTSSSTATITAGSTATYNLALTPASGFTGTVTVACSGAPTGATCTLNPATAVSVTARDASTLAVSVTTTARSTANALPGPFPRSGFLWATALLPGLVLAGRKSVKVRKSTALTGLGLALVSVMLLASCGAGGSGSSGNSVRPSTPATPAGSYTITVTGTTTAGTHSYDLKLIVN